MHITIATVVGRPIWYIYVEIDTIHTKMSFVILVAPLAV